MEHLIDINTGDRESLYPQATISEAKELFDSINHPEVKKSLIKIFGAFGTILVHTAKICKICARGAITGSVFNKNHSYRT